MSHTHLSILIHSVFSTKNRQRYLAPHIQDRLWPFLGGIARKNHFKLITIGGIEDHVHLLLSLPGDLPISKAMQILKGSSSRWLHDTFSDLRDFDWQDGYAAFSVSKSAVERVTDYIQRQREHHKKCSFEEEFLSFLRAHQIPYDPKYVFG